MHAPEGNQHSSVVHWSPIKKEGTITGFSRSQIDRLGDRLRTGEPPSDEDLTMLDLYQQSLQRPMQETLEVVARAFGQAFPAGAFQPTARVKQLRSIVAKLQRQTTRLSAMQDLLGFRVVLPGIVDQEVLQRLLPGTPDWQRIDRRAQPSHGYRALHIVRRSPAGFIEVQLRSRLQHQWAELSEYADRVAPGAKYGQGDNVMVASVLERMSGLIAEVEDLELQAQHVPDAVREHEHMRELRSRLVDFLDDILRDMREGGV